MQKESHNPRTEEMMNVINELQRAHKTANEELRKSQAEREALKKELDELNTEKTHLEDILSMKQETLKLLQQRCNEEENKIQSLQAMSQDCIRKIADLNSKIQEEKLRRRKQRLDFEEQLEELMGKHKDTPETLAQEINSTASSKEQLLLEEKLIQEKLDAMEKQLPGLPHPKAKAEALAVHSVDTFLRSEEAAAAMHLFEEENKKAMQFLEAASQHYHQLQQKYYRLKMELEAGGQRDIRGSKGSNIETAAEGGSDVVAEGALSECLTESLPAVPRGGNPETSEAEPTERSSLGVRQ
ncbi:synaptonemal complex central element protein 1-like isoform X2 [Vombatus ursinus]|uniref:synaptonemal complex central element protein 1-like isoform X2 n=1 Tax=Vombatus ursinus TaxID=29139 RepID=UPI000FFD4385|nr:synaptonemal complex central element protein 1-like isoform X2 [Vombatus ursinus]